MRNRSRDKPKTTNAVSRLPAFRLPDLIHIEGDRDRHHARDPACPAAEEASAQGCSPVPDQRAAAPQPEGVATQGGPPSARVTRAPAKLRTAAGARDDHEPHQLYNYSL